MSTIPELRADQLAPHCTEAEEAVLGSILISPGCLDDVLQRIAPSDFFIVRHAWILEAMIALRGQNIPIDHLTLTQALEQQARLAEIGGAAYLLGLINKTPSALNVEGYAGIVAGMAVRRRLIEAAQDTAHWAHSEELSLPAIYDRITRRFDEVSSRLVHTARSARVVFSDFIGDFALRVQDAREGRPHVGLKTGLAEWDAVFGGDFDVARYSVLFGPTNIGKTWAMLQFAISAARQAPVVYISLENQEDSIAERMIAIESGVPFTAVHTGDLYGGEEWQDACYQASDRLAALPLELITHLNSAEEIGRFLRGATTRLRGPGLCFIDTINAMADSQSRDDRYANLTRGSARLLQIMRMTGWGIIASAQLRNELVSGMTAKAAKAAAWPTMQSLEGARTITQHVSNLIGMYSPDYVAKHTHTEFTDSECPSGQVVFVNLKSRDTQGDGTCRVAWNKRIPCFEAKNTVRVPLDDLLDAPTTFAAATAQKEMAR